jgi:anti-sigma B factor antagonist
VPDVGLAVVMVKGVPVVTAPAEVDIQNAALLRAALLRAAARGRGVIILDMSATEFCDSAGLSVLIRAHRRALAEDCHLRVVTSTIQVNRILEITGLDRLLQRFRTLEEAMQPLALQLPTAKVAGTAS